MKIVFRPFILLLLTVGGLHAQKFEELAQTPPMGWNTWNTFATEINEELIKDTAEAMIKSGMRDAGYVYIVLDDAWMAMERDGNGDLVADPDRFPSGMKALGDYLHERGFKFGIYNCAGTETCAGYPGTRGFEYQDARLYASWGVDYLKYDWCNTGKDNAYESYKTMRDALYAAGRPIVFSICEWGTNEPWKWAGEIGHLWRTTTDIIDCYDCSDRFSLGWKPILDLQMSLDGGWKGLSEFAGPGGWNDPDMMEVGNEGLTLEESRAHFSTWCMLAAPLIAGNDVRDMTPEIIDILTDKDLIAINQDPLGKQGFRYLQDSEKEVWVKELSNGDWAFCALNLLNEPNQVSIDWSRFVVLKGNYTIRDLWNKKSLGTTSSMPILERKLNAHDVMVFRLSR